MTDSVPGRTAVRDHVVDYLRAQYLGPASGEHETLSDRPDRVYLVGTLYPRGRASERLDGDVLGDEGHDDELDEQVELANTWYPASAAVSFLHDGDTVTCSVRTASYARDPAIRDWSRTPLVAEDLVLAPPPDGTAVRDLFGGRARLSSVWRRTGDKWLVTVAIENRAVHDDAESPPPTEDCLFQVELDCRVSHGAVLPYPSSRDLTDDPEDQELRLLYRNRRAYGAGHGCSVDWHVEADGVVRAVSTQMLPATVVPAVKARDDLGLAILELSRLADPDLDPDTLHRDLLEFVAVYEQWIAARAAELSTLPAEHVGAGARLIERMRTAATRMIDGVELLRRDETARVAFRLANAAMREQMLQTAHVRRHPGRRGVALSDRATGVATPRWRPFQLGFQLLTLASTGDPTHPDRELVDLLWFPTGGGKTEAYLALAAFEMIRRRLARGLRGGGTAVLTRYTLRLLTTQQFQRSATLVCALERLRGSEPCLAGTPAFTIGLWVGGETTPNSYKSAHELVTRLRRSQNPESPFQIQDCPWCGTSLLPRRRSDDIEAYGVRSTAHSFELFCPHAECDFHDLLPVGVVDEQIFADPPSLLVATVDKLARLPWVRDAGSLFGQNNVPFDPPGLVIQDELHLLSGPLGTTVALYESAVQSLLGWEGVRAKIVASTATIRAAEHQVRNLYGSPVRVFPPSGLGADDSFFAVTDPHAPGRLYLGVMPQAHTQAFATVLATVALLQAPKELALTGPALDAYWTVVAYHNSLRELGRTVTIARDDVDSMLQARRRTGEVRALRRDGVVELTSNVSASQLPVILARLERSVEHDDAVDLVATTNMLSVGIDVSRLGLMLMNGQPKTTSEYIQATSRVGRADVPGLVVTLLRSGKPRDRSHYETFRAYHEALYRYVEPTSVTPWSLASRRRSLHAALTLLVRHGCGLRGNDDAGDFSVDDPLVGAALRTLREWAARADADEAADADADLHRLAGEWEHRARSAERSGTKLRYASSDKDTPALLRDFGERKDGWETMHSMRSVDRQVRVLAIGEVLS
ncbi:MAG: helicase [Pseudonocardiales bacterium]|nr:MAG: helicase [Pseudonocardiales bacterium]